MGARHTPATTTLDIQAILHFFDDEGLRPAPAWSNGPGDAYAPHEHAYKKVLFCVRGSITFELPDSSERIVLAPGDRLEIDAHTVHAAVAGPQGVTCIEAAS